MVATRASGQWSASDRQLLAMYITALLDVQRLDAEIAKHGEIVQGRISPLVTVRNMREQRLLAIASRLRLLPSNRYTGRDVARMHGYALAGNAANESVEDDDLLAGSPTPPRHLQ